MSFFRNVDLVKPDAAFHITDAYNADSHLHKVNLSVDAYKDEEGKPCVLPVVRRVEAAMACDHTLNHEYLPITGLTSFTDAVSKLLLGSASSAIVDRRVRNLLPWQHCSRAASIWHREALFVVF
jgi:aspartate aminotransferase